MIEYKCECGETYCRLDEEYVNNHPDGSDLAEEAAFLHHIAHECVNASDYDIVDICDDCGEEISRLDIEYVNCYPNGSDMARAQAYDQHKYDCVAILEAEWKEWRESSLAGNQLPRQFLKNTYFTEGAEACRKIPAPPDRTTQGQGGWTRHDIWQAEVEEYLFKQGEAIYKEKVWFNHELCCEAKKQGRLK
jgi:hypothetical protein